MLVAADLGLAAPHADARTAEGSVAHGALRANGTAETRSASQVITQLVDVLRKEVAQEIEVPTETPKSKVAVAVISSLGLGFFGVDRCYMGMTCLGIFKGLTP